ELCRIDVGARGGLLARIEIEAEGIAAWNQPAFDRAREVERAALAVRKDAVIRMPRRAGKAEPRVKRFACVEIVAREDCRHLMCDCHGNTSRGGRSGSDQARRPSVHRTHEALGLPFESVLFSSAAPLVASRADPDIVPSGGWRWTGPSPTRSGPEGSSRNEFRPGSLSSLPPLLSPRVGGVMSEPGSAYRVLARKYRPSTFAELIGQEAMVRTLTNAIASGRIAHAFILTGVRGVGKTTTARILARALNCIAPDGKGGPTISPCGQCDPCRAIAEDRHVDVMEMDAASRTGVDDIRELTDGVRYKPVAARFKIYIIDEVHMLSKNAFNALLKTLEEPPAVVKIISATTEIHKVPITVLSRCQRFSLRRVPVELLVEHYSRIAAAEGVSAEPAAVALIARAADGSVRDGLSLLDQAIALGGGAIGESAVRDMLGVADRGLVFDVLEAVLKGDAPDALRRMAALYEGGA